MFLSKKPKKSAPYRFPNGNIFRRDLAGIFLIPVPSTRTGNPLRVPKRVYLRIKGAVTQASEEAGSKDRSSAKAGLLLLVFKPRRHRWLGGAAWLGQTLVELFPHDRIGAVGAAFTLDSNGLQGLHPEHVPRGKGQVLVDEDLPVFRDGTKP